VYGFCIQYTEFISAFITKSIKINSKLFSVELFVGLLARTNAFLCVFRLLFFAFKLIDLMHRTWKNKPVLLSLAASLSSYRSTGSNSLGAQSVPALLVTTFASPQTSPRTRPWVF
jgi:hypothetical protein